MKPPENLHPHGVANNGGTRLPEATEALRRAKAALTIQRYWTGYKLRKEIGKLRKDYGWFFDWRKREQVVEECETDDRMDEDRVNDNDNDPDHQETLPKELEFDSLQRMFREPAFFRQVKVVLELLGSAKSASRCHVKMLLMAFMLRHHRTLLKPVSEETHQSSSSSPGECEDLEYSARYLSCDGLDPDYEYGRNVCDPSLCQLIDVLGRAWLGVCSDPWCWFMRMRFMVAYARYSKGFLEWKARDSREMVEVEVLRFVDTFTTMSNMRQVVADGRVHGSIAFSLEWGRRDCEQRLRNLTSLLGSAGKARELIREELMRHRIMSLVRGKLGVSKGEPLVFFEWSDDRKLVDHWMVRLAAMSTAECGRAAAGTSRRIAVPRLGTRQARLAGPTLLRQWWGSDYARLVKLKEHMRRGLETGSQIAWVPLFMAHAMRVMTRWVIRDAEKARKFAAPIDSEFIAQQCAMNNCDVLTYVAYIVGAMKEFCALPRVDEIRALEKRFVVNKEPLKEPLLNAFLDLLENLRVDACMPSLHAAVQSLAQQPPNNELYAFVNDLHGRRLGLGNALCWVEVAKKDADALLPADTVRVRQPSTSTSDTSAAPATGSSRRVLAPAARLPRLQLYFAKTLTQLPSAKALAHLPETFVMLYLPVLNVQMLVRDTVVAFAICQYAAGLGRGDGATICRFKNTVLSILRASDADSDPQRTAKRIHDAIDAECFCMSDSDRSILFSLVDSLVAPHAADETTDAPADKVASLAHSRICAAIQHSLVHGDTKPYDGPKLENFTCDVANICRQAEHIWKSSFDAYKPIYEVLLECNRLWRC